MKNKDIANAIRWHRENLDFSAKQVALHLNLSQSSYSKIENANRLITVAEFKLVSDLFKLSMNDLINIPNSKS